MKTIILYALILFGLLFLFGLNLLLHGRFRSIVEGILSLVCMGMLIMSFFLFGWKIGIGMIVFTFITIPIAKALSVPLAYRLLGYRTGYGEHLLIESDWQQFMSGKISYEDHMHNSEMRVNRVKKTLAKIAKRADIRAVLQENSISQEGFLELYWVLIENSLPDLVWDILSNTGKLQQLIDLKKKGAQSHEISATFREYS